MRLQRRKSQRQSDYVYRIPRLGYRAQQRSIGFGSDARSAEKNEPGIILLSSWQQFQMKAPVNNRNGSTAFQKPSIDRSGLMQMIMKSA
jgi:hypothetical protein